MSLARHSFYTTLSQILIQFFGILSGIIMTRMLGPEGRGVYALYFTNAQLIFTFASLSFNGALIYFIPAGKVSPEKMLGLAFIVNALSSVVSLIIILSSYFSPLRSVMFSDSYMGIAFLAWLIFYTIALIYSSTYSSFFQATRRFPQLNINNLATSIFSLLSFVALLLAKDYIPTNVELFLLILFASQFFSIFLFALNLHGKLKIKPSFHFSLKHDFPGLKRFVLALHLSILANFFNYRFSTWVINFYLNEAALGWYSLAVNVGGVFSLVTDPLAMVLTPYLSEQQGDDKEKMFSTYFRIFFWIMIIAAGFAIIFAPWLIPWVYGSEFEPSVLLFQIAVPGIIIAAMTKILASFVISNGKQEYNLYATLIGFMIAISTNILMIKYWDVQGAVIANLLTYCSIFVFLLWLSIKKLKLKPGGIFLFNLSDIQILKNGIYRILHR